jgi:hypothetical protein
VRTKTGSAKRTRPRTRRIRLYALLGLLAALAGSGVWWLGRDREPWSPERAAGQEYAAVRDSLTFPEEVRQAPADVRELYEFAARRPDVLRYMPCFCGCWREGHRSNYDCFVDEVHRDGRVDIDRMGFT